MNSKPIKLASISDIHLGHHRTTTGFIVENLRKAFPDTDETGELDLILFAGDVFDRLLSFPSTEASEAADWFMDFLAMCQRRDIVVRVLEGTPSHDWKQSSFFVGLNRNLLKPADFKYVPTLSIEYLDRFDLTILYVPDEWSPEADDTWRQTTELLAAHGLEKVDIACMHGAFDYQIPMSHNTHRPDRWLSIVKHYIFIGHVHLHSVNDRILAQGSFDRLCHGEEAPKGHIRAVIRGEQGDQFEFVENKGAKLYLTLELQGRSLTECLDALKGFEHFPDGSNFRLKMQREDEMLGAIQAVRELYPQFVFTTQLDELEVKSALIEEDDNIPQPITITRDNLASLLKERMPEVAEDVEKEMFRILDELTK